MYKLKYSIDLENHLISSRVVTENYDKIQIKLFLISILKYGFSYFYKRQKKILFLQQVLCFGFNFKSVQ